MLKRSNEEWLAQLRTDSPEQDAALTDLRAIIKKGLPYALSRWLSPSDPQFESLIEETTQDTLLRVLDQKESFEGRSQFTTWVHKIAIRIALSELRRKRWKDVSLHEMVDNDDAPPPPRLMADPQASPESASERSDMISHIQRIIAEELTDKQRQALVSISIQGMPLEEVASRMGTNRNALYKLMHDARLRLNHRMEEEGLSPEDVLTSFE